MTEQATTILQEALALPEADRAAVAEQLLATLKADGDECSDDALHKELEERLEDYRMNPDVAVLWSDLKNER